MRVGVLGPVVVWTDQGQVVGVREAKVRALLARLAVDVGVAVSADRLIEDVWGDRLPADPTGTLQTKIFRLRRAFDAAEPDGRSRIRHSPAGYVLALSPEQVDAHAAEALAERARTTTDARQRASVLAEALALWRGPAFADFADEDFARSAITRLEELRLTLVEDHAEARLEAGEHRAIVSELAALVEQHPTRERLRAVQMRALYRGGRHRDALAAFDELRRHLLDELGLDPGPELTGLHVAILNHDPSLRADPESAAAGPRPRRHLRIPATELIGRDDEVRRLRRQLGGHRLVTLIGPGGVGKTRLAMEVAARVEADFPDGVFLVELDGIVPTAPDGRAVIAQAVADVLGVRLGAEPISIDDDDAAVLHSAIGDRQLLLIADNCEHLIEPVAALVAGVIGATNARVLATSREPLRIPGEVLADIPPLSVPDSSHVLDLVMMRRSTAVQLFEQRAATSGFELDETNTAAVAEICRRLDGHPLAIELAAARVRSLGVVAIAERLDERFSLLAVRQRGVPARHHTLEAVIDWSWQLLDDDQRAVLRRLSVCAPGFDLAAAEAVAGADPVRRVDVATVVADLVDRSLITPTDGAAGVRYRLWESVAAYAADRGVEAGDHIAARSAHRRFYVDRVEHANNQLRGSGQRRALDLLDDDMANIRHAIDTAVHDGDAASALRAGHALGWYWFLRGRVAEARRTLSTALAIERTGPLRSQVARAAGWHAGFEILGGSEHTSTQLADRVERSFTQADDPAGQATVMWFLGYVAFGIGDQAAGEDITERALQLFRGLDDSWGTAAALLTRARHALLRGSLDTLKHDAEQAATEFERLGDQWGELQSHQVLGSLAEIHGDYQTAAHLHRRALQLADELGLGSGATYSLIQLGRLALLQDDLDTAIELHRRGRRHAVEQSHIPLVRVADFGLALCYRRTGQLDDSEAILLALLERNRIIGSDAGIALAAGQLGLIAEERGNYHAALALHHEALRAARATGDDRAIALTYEGLAGAYAGLGHDLFAAELLGAAETARANTNAPLAIAERRDVERITHLLRRRIGRDAFDRHAERGAQRATALYSH